MHARPNLVLASSSSIRRRLLVAAGIRFTTAPADVDETPRGDEDPQSMARRLAVDKARAARAGAEDWVLGADQVFTLDGAYLPKPCSEEEVLEKLRAMNGRVHRFHCGLALIRGGEVVRAAVDAVDVRFHECRDEELVRYARTGEGIGCAGAYRLEEGGVRLVAEIRGSHFTVLGLPMLLLVAWLRDLGLTPDIYEEARP